MIHLNLQKLVRIFSIVWILLVAFLLTGCGSTQSGGVPQSRSIDVSVAGVSANISSVVIEARQGSMFVTANAIISGNQAISTLRLNDGTWNMGAKGFTTGNALLAYAGSTVSISGQLTYISLTFTMPNNDDLLVVSGSQVKNQKGVVIPLRGLGLANGVYDLVNPADIAASIYNLTDIDYQNIKNMGCNVVRFYIQYYWLSDANKTAFFNYLDQQIMLARTYHVYIILNLHYFGTSVQYKQGTEDGFYRGASKYDVLKFWNLISSRYKSEPIIAGYDLINETNCWSGFKESDMYAKYSAIISTIRANADSHVIFVSDPVTKYGNQTASYHNISGAFSKLSDTNIVYEYHWYQPFPFTHQGAIFLDDPPSLGAIYPNGDYAMADNGVGGYISGYYANPYWKITPAPNANGWQELVGNWVDFTTNTDCIVKNTCTGTNFDNGSYVFNIGLSSGGLNGQVWYDDVILEKRVKGSAITQLISVKNSHFTISKFYNNWSDPIVPVQTQAWFSVNDPGTSGVTFTWDGAGDANGDLGSGALKIDGSAANWAAVGAWANWKQSGEYTPIETGYEYRVRAKVKITNNTAYAVSLGLDVFKINHLIDKTYLQSMIQNYYTAWASSKTVPIFCGEFGVTNPSRLAGFTSPSNSPTDQIQYVTDMVDILNNTTTHWTYHTYKNYGGKRLDIFGLFDGAVPDVGLINALKTGL